MKHTIERRIGESLHTFTFEGSDLFETTWNAQMIGFEDIPCCGLCASVKLDLRARYPQEKYRILYVFCKDCKAQLDFVRFDNYGTKFLPRTERGMLSWYTPNMIRKAEHV